MVLLLIVIGITAALFSAILETDDFFNKNKRPGIKQNIIAILPGIAIFILYYNFPDNIILLVVSGIIIIVYSFFYLSIIQMTGKKHHFIIYFFLIIILSAISNLEWTMSLIGPLTFCFCYMIFFFLARKFILKQTKDFDNIRQILELNTVLNGIFLLIIGLILATDRFSFFEKIAQYLIN